MKFKFLRAQPMPPLAQVFLDAVEQHDERQDDFKAGYLACYEDLVSALKDKNISTLVDLQDVMGKLARKGKSL